MPDKEQQQGEDRADGKQVSGTTPPRIADADALPLAESNLGIYLALHTVFGQGLLRAPSTVRSKDPLFLAACKDIEGLYVRDDGSIWVLSAGGARDAEDGELGTFDVYNKEGHFVRNVTLLGEGDSLDDLYLFVKDRFYVVTDFLQAAMVAQGVQGLYDEEDEAEPMAVLCYKLDGDVLAAR